MAQVVSFEDYRPSPRYDGLPWTTYRIEEGTASAGPWSLIDQGTIAPLDVDPSQPSYRNFTTSSASDLPDLWYRIIFVDADGAVGLPTTPVRNSAEERPVYATTVELAALLRVRDADRHASLLRVLKSASQEIDSEIGTADITGEPLPYSSPPALVSEVCLERAVEHWKQMEVPFGIMGMGDATATYTARDSWDRHAHKLAPLKGSWGLA